MKVKALKNLIYNGSFFKAGEVFLMSDKVVVAYENRKLVIRLLQNSKPEAKVPDLPASLPPLTVDGKKKK